MANTTTSGFINIISDGLDNKNSSIKEIISATDFKVLAHFDKNGPEAQNDRKAEELFSSFTASIIKEETLFIR